MRVLLFVLVAVFLPAVLSVPTQLSYTLGKQYVYAVSGVVDSRGQDVTSGDRTPGSLGRLTSTMVMEPTKTDDDSYTFVMNMFNTVVGVDQDVAGNKDLGNAPLGYDMYFQQKKTGEIVQIWYNTADSPFYVNIKVASINSFQTSLLNVGDVKIVAESDPIGVHTAKLSGAAGSDTPLVISKTFTQNDITRFVDPTLTSSNVQINALGSVGVHAAGYVTAASVQQLSVLSNAGKTTVTRGLTNSTGFDMDLSSQGTLTHTLQGIQSNFKPLNTSITQSYISDTLFGVSVKARLHALQQAHTIDNAAQLFLKAIKEPALSAATIATLTKVGKHIQFNPTDAAEVILPVLKSGKADSDVVLLDKIFFVLSVAQLNEYVFKYGLNSQNEKVRARAVLACASLEAPSAEIVEALRTLAEKDAIALHVYGIVAGKSDSRVEEAEFMQKNAQKAIDEQDEDALISWINAIGNSGIRHQKHKTFRQVVRHNNPAVRLAAVYALRKFADSHRVKGLLRNIFETDAETVVVKAAADILKDVTLEFTGSDLPFNKSYSKQINIGGKVADTVFEVDLLAGTNFNCANPTFNYEASAQAKATAALFGVSKEAFAASGIYGKINGSPLADLIQVSVWGDVIYSKTIPSVDCSLHTYPLASTSPGFSVSYTLWVSIVPVVFSASVSLNLKLSWGWQVCDADLSAMIELIPAGDLVVSGSVTVDLLLLRAGLELSANFNEDVQPQLYIHGSQCELGFQVIEDASPMAAQFDSYFMWRECKFLFFNCHWGQHNQKTWWNWSRPATHQTLFNQAWKISA